VNERPHRRRHLVDVAHDLRRVFVNHARADQTRASPRETEE
jgi:hypothetical protein